METKKKHFLFISLLISFLAISATITAQAVAVEGEELHELHYENDILGVALNYPTRYQITEQQYLSNVYGFGVVDSAKNPLFDVDWLLDSGDRSVEQLAEETRAKFPNIPIVQTPIQVDQRSAVLLSPVPGIVANSVILVAANDRIYTLRYYRESLDDLGWSLLNGVRFYSPRQSLEELGLTHADDVLFIPQHLEEVLQPDSSEVPPLLDGVPESVSPSNPPLPLTQLGCTYYAAIVRVQWTSGAGSSSAGPSFYGQGLHVDCDSNSNYNDYYALDHPLDEMDLIYPHKGGTVIFSGWADAGWKTLGRMVIIDYGGGYWGVMAHLKYIATVAQPGNNVGSNTVIGYAGGSGDYQDNYWGVHLHQSINKDAQLSLNPNGIYDGQSARPNGYQYFGGGGGIYWAWNLTSGATMSH